MQHITRNQSAINWQKREEKVLDMVSKSRMPISMLLISMASDAQEFMHRGLIDTANEILNDMKIIIDSKVGQRDEHGRHV